MKELSLHILDIAQNSIIALANIIRITVKEDTSKDELIILIEDNGQGMDKETINKVKDPFFTSRKTRKVGLGIPLLQAAAKRCGGDLEIQSEPGKGTRVTAYFINSHIDRAPMGNLCDTLLSLIVCNELIDFIYTHVYNGKTFEINTKEIKEKLGEVPIALPEVIEWIKGYLIEGINSLYGGANNEINTGIGRNKEENSSDDKC